MIRKLSGLLTGMLVCMTVIAAGTQLRGDHPDTYTVRRGDTLWAISAKFLAKPWLWPEIWQANPQVQNPHLIYPGDVLNLSLADGTPRLRLSPGVRESEDAVPAIPLSELRMFLKDTRVIESNALSDAPYVVGFEEAQLRGTVGQNIYVRKLAAQPGQRWAIVRPSHVFRGYDEKRDGTGGELIAHRLDSDVNMVASPWREDFRNDGHYGRGRDLGVEVTVVGTAEVLRGGDPSTLLLLDATREIRQGDRLLPIDEHPYDPYYYPHPPKALPNDARVIAFTDALSAAGSRQVVALSIGARDGVENGQVYAVFQPGESIHDDVAGSTFQRSLGHDVTLPDEFAGHVMVFRTFDRVSYGLIMDGLKPVTIGAKLQLPD
jgi:LysM repeat protein